MSPMKKIVFICYGNACRSQMSEGLFRNIGNESFEIFSAGTNPLGSIPEEVFRVLKKRGIDASRQYSKGLGEIPLLEMDYVINMGYYPVADFLPNDFSGYAVDWEIEDPYGDSLETYERVCQVLEQRLQRWLASRR